MSAHLGRRALEPPSELGLRSPRARLLAYGCGVEDELALVDGPAVVEPQRDARGRDWILVVGALVAVIALGWFLGRDDGTETGEPAVPAEETEDASPSSSTAVLRETVTTLPPSTTVEIDDVLINAGADFRIVVAGTGRPFFYEIDVATGAFRTVTLAELSVPSGVESFTGGDGDVLIDTTDQGIWQTDLADGTLRPGTLSDEHPLGVSGERIYTLEFPPSYPGEVIVRSQRALGGDESTFSFVASKRPVFGLHDGEVSIGLPGGLYVPNADGFFRRALDGDILMSDRGWVLRQTCNAELWCPIELVDLAGEAVYELGLSARDFDELSISPNRRWLVTNLPQGLVVDLTDGSTRAIDMPVGGVQSWAWSPDGEWVLVQLNAVVTAYRPATGESARIRLPDSLGHIDQLGVLGPLG